MTPKIFRLNDCEWWAGYDLESVMAGFLAETGMAPDEAFDDPRELTEKELNRLRFWRENDQGTCKHTVTFRQELDRQIAEGDAFPCLFASTEY